MILLGKCKLQSAKCERDLSREGGGEDSKPDLNLSIFLIL